MKNKSGVLSLLGTGLIVLASLASCGVGGGATNVDVTLPTDDPTSEVTIEFWECLGHDKEDNLLKIVDKFNTTYAGKYKVKLSKIAGDYDSLHDAVKTKLAAGEVPALCMGYPDSFSEYISNNIEDSAILRLDNFINDETFGYTKAEIADFVPEYYAEGQNYQYSGIWSMPMYKSTEVMYYNINYFAGDNAQTKVKLASDTQYATLLATVTNMGAKPTTEALTALKTYVREKGGYAYDVPATWTDMVAVSEDMIADMKTEGVSDEFFPVGYDSDANMFISQFEQRDIDYTSNSEESKTDKSKHFLFNNDKAKTFTNDVVKLVKDKILITKGTLGGDKYTNTYFNQGKLAMSIGSTGGSSYQVSANFGVGLAPVPYSGTQKYIMQGPSICFFDNLDDYVAKGSWLFYKELAEPENNCALALENSYDPVRVSSYETENYKTWLSHAGKGVLSYDIPKITSTLKDYYMTSPVFIGSSTARTQIGSILQYVLNQNMSVDAAFTTAYNTCISAAL